MDMVHQLNLKLCCQRLLITVFYNLAHIYISNDMDLKWNNVISYVAHQIPKSDLARKKGISPKWQDQAWA